MTSADTLSGRVFGTRYRILSLAGEGGMAAVYKGIDEVTGASVAVKVLRSELTLMVGADRFTREIGIAQKLDHPNIVPLLDSGVEDQLSYFVMPLVKGGTLRERITQHAQLTVEETLFIATAVGAALAHAHKAGIVHRDIKPENVLLDERQVYVSDFGIARLLEVPGLEQKLSTTGLVIGTPAYMSPEQSVADPRLDPRSDIYSLGCVMYEMLAGTAPFTGATPQAIAARHMVETPPPLRVVRPNVPAHVAAAIERCLAKSPAERFQSMEELLRSLDAASAPAVGTASRSHFVKMSVAALLAVSFIGAGTYRTMNSAAGGGGPDRYAVFPLVVRGDAAPDLLTGVKAAALLYDALRPVADSQLVDRLRLESELQAHGVPTRLDSIQAMTRALGANRTIWGEVVARVDSVFVYAQMYDAARRAREPLSKAVVAFAVQDAQAVGDGARIFNQQFTTLARRLITRSATTQLSDLLGTDLKPALLAKLSADSARYRWNLEFALQRYRDALAIDPRYAQASLGLAQISEWLDVPVTEWQGAANQAFAFKASLTDRDALVAEALRDFGEERYLDACEVYARMLARDSLSFDALFGLGECQFRDNQVVREARSPTGFRFRGSYEAAGRNFDRALRTVPLSLRDDRAVTIDRLLRVLPTKQFLRPGTFESVSYAALPTMVEDTIVFFPVPLADLLAEGPDSATVRQMEALFQRNAERLSAYTAIWVHEFPRNANAWYAHAGHLERSGRFDGDSMNSALFSIRRARALAEDEHVRLQYAVDELRILVRTVDAGAVKALADTLLRRDVVTPDDARLLSRVAALVGDRERLRTLLELWKGATVLRLNDGQSYTLPKPVANAASALFWYSVTGASADSLTRFENALQRELTRWSPANEEAIARELTFMPALLGFPWFGVRPAHRRADAPGDLKAQLHLAEGNVSARAAELSRMRARVNAPGVVVRVDAACVDAALLAKTGNQADVQDALARLVRSAQHLSGSLLADFQVPAMLQRCRPLLDASSSADIQKFADFLKAISKS